MMHSMCGVSSQRVYGSTASSLTNPAAWLTHPAGQDLELHNGCVTPNQTALKNNNDPPPSPRPETNKPTMTLSLP
jgi:hypothetical protein